jgi:hypothetical protein
MSKPDKEVVLTESQLSTMLQTAATQAADKVMHVLSDGAAERATSIKPLAAEIETMMDAHQESEESKTTLRDQLSGLPEDGQKTWAAVFYGTHPSMPKDDIALMAWDVVKNKYEKIDGSWKLIQKGKIEFNKTNNLWMVYNHSHPVGFKTEAGAKEYATIILNESKPTVTKKDNGSYEISHESFGQPVVAQSADEAEGVVSRTLQTSEGLAEADSMTEAKKLVVRQSIDTQSEKENTMASLNVKAETSQVSGGGPAKAMVSGIATDEGAKSGGKHPTIGGKVVAEKMAKDTIPAAAPGGLQSKHDGNYAALANASDKAIAALVKAKGIQKEDVGGEIFKNNKSTSEFKEQSKLASVEVAAAVKQSPHGGANKEAVSGLPGAADSVKSGGKQPSGIPGRVVVDTKGKGANDAAHKGVAELERAKGLKTEKPAKAVYVSGAELEAMASAFDQQIASVATERTLASELQSFTKEFGVRAAKKGLDKGLSALARKFKKGKRGFDTAACVAHLTEDLGAEAAEKFSKFLEQKVTLKQEAASEDVVTEEVAEPKVEEVVEQAAA